jgi:small subunit ribosomal protein S1
MEGVESDDEAHNLERPARAALKKKKPAGKDLSEFSEGSTVKGTIKSIASYGAFVDIGASTDGLLHVSQLSAGFVSDVSEVVKEGQEVEVRIVKIEYDDRGRGCCIEAKSSIRRWSWSQRR